MKSRYVDFNTLLVIANLFVAGLLVSLVFELHSNEYVDQETIWLGIALCAQTHLALRRERRHRDPFVILLAFEMVFYYELRIFTLELYPFSGVFDRFAYGPEDSNFALIFILIANVLLYAGLYAVRFKETLLINARGWRASSPLSVVMVLVMAIVFAYASGSFWSEGNVPRALNFLQLFLTPNISILMAVTYYFLFRSFLSRQFAFAIACLIVAEMIAHTLWGSRSAVVVLIQTCILVGLAIAGSIRFRKSTAVVGALLMPILLVILVGTFTISTYNRSVNRSAGEMSSLDIGKSVATAAQSASELASGPAADVVLPPIFSRAGFFDYSAEIMAHREEYAEVFNVGAYGRSILDNLLTPGFDVYDQPKISNAMRFIYDGLGTPAKSAVTEDYQSDQFGIYGEYYALFGWASLPCFFLTTFILKWLYVRANSANPFLFAMKRIVILIFFVRTLDSFGFDWTLIEMIPLFISIYGYMIFFSIRRERPAYSNEPQRENPTV